MKLNLQGLLGAIGELPGVVSKGLLGPLPNPNPQLGLDPGAIKGFQDQALTDMAYGMLGASQSRNPWQQLAQNRGAVQENYRGRVFDMLKEQEIGRLRAAQKAEEDANLAAAEQEASLNEAMVDSTPPAGLPIPPEAWAQLPWKAKVTLYGQYTPPKPEGPMSVAPGSAVVDPNTGQVIYKNPDRPSGGGFQIVMPGTLPNNIPATVRTALSANEELIRTIDKTLEESRKYKEKHPGKSATGPFRAGSIVAADSILPGAPGVGISDMMDPDGIVVRQGVADVGSMEFHDRSGAAVTLSESPRMRPFIPEGNKHMDVNEKNLMHLRDKAVQENQVILGGYGVQYTPGMFGGAVQQGQPAAQQPAPTMEQQGGLPVVKSDMDYDKIGRGESYVAPDGTIRVKK